MIKEQVVISDISNKYINYLCCFTFVFLIFFASSSWAQDGPSGYQITSPITGLIKQVYVSSGQSVKKGDLLLDYQDDLILSDLSEAQSRIKMEKLNQSEAKKEFARAEELYDRTVLSEQELQQAEISYRKALAQYAAAKNQLVHAQWNLDQSKLYATFSGTVSQVYVYPGQFVNNKLTAQTLLIIK